MSNTRSICLLLVCVMMTSLPPHVSAGQLRAGAAKVDITDRKSGPVNDPLHARALVVNDGSLTLVIVTMDVVAIGEIGNIGNDFLPRLRHRIQKEIGIPPEHVLVNASHCHGVPCADVDERTFQAVKNAAQNMVPVLVGAGTGQEDRVMENRRLKLKSGKEVDVRHAYSMPPDEDVAEVGPVDPEIGILRLNDENGQTVAVVYNFACHPIQSNPGGRNTADMTGFSSQVIEDNLSENTVALFVQGCGGDINPVYYKDVAHPRRAEPLGNMLGLTTLKALKTIDSRPDDRLLILNETLELPRADIAQRIIELESEQQRLVRSLGGTSLNLKTFLPLMVRYNLWRDFPSYYSHGYLHEEARGRDDLRQLDAENRRNIQRYIGNVYTMERLTRNNTNLNLLRKHQEKMLAAEKRTLDVELAAVRIGDFVLLTFPGELTVRIGLNIKRASTHDLTFVAGYTNGYIYYAPTTEQLLNVGGAQEDSDCMLAPHWQKIYEDKALDMLGRLLSK